MSLLYCCSRAVLLSTGHGAEEKNSIKGAVWGISRYKSGLAGLVWFGIRAGLICLEATTADEPDTPAADSHRHTQKTSRRNLRSTNRRTRAAPGRVAAQWWERACRTSCRRTNTGAVR